jgi:hypothetical protein
MTSTLFTDAMALTAVSDGVFDGALNEHWTIGPKVHGGAMLALCANAARTAQGGGLQPIATAANYLWAPEPGPMRLVTSVRKRGRRVSVVDVELNQGDRTAVRATVTLGEPEHHVAPLLSDNPVIPLMPPEPPPGLDPIGPGHPLAPVVHLAHGCDIRPSLTPPSDHFTGAAASAVVVVSVVISHPFGASQFSAIAFVVAVSVLFR